MALPLALFAVSSMVKTLGRFKADADQANAERANASFYKEQEKFSLEEMFREVQIFDRKSTKLKGEQIGAAGASGTAITAFTLDRLGQESALMSAERSAIIRQGEFKAKLAGLRAQQSTDTADALNSPERMISNVGGLLTDAAMLKF